MHMQVVTELLKESKPSVCGRADPILHTHRTWPLPSSEFVQITYVDNYHWVTLSHIGILPGRVAMYDSFHLSHLSTETQVDISSLLQTFSERVTIAILNVQR